MIKKSNNIINIKRFENGFLSLTVVALFTIFLLGCSINPEDKYLKKEKIGVFGENQGMVTFEGQLFSDSTFFIPGNFMDWAEGTFRIQEGYIHFAITDGSNAYFEPIALKLDSAKKQLEMTNLEQQINYVYLQK